MTDHLRAEDKEVQGFVKSCLGADGADCRPNARTGLRLGISNWLLKQIRYQISWSVDTDAYIVGQRGSRERHHGQGIVQAVER